LMIFIEILRLKQLKTITHWSLNLGKLF
jgi:hypothetical protein